MIPDYILHEPEEAYHARSKSGEMLSSHMLAKFQEMPFKYSALIHGLCKEPDKAEYEFGRAAHKMILEGREAFNTEYVVNDGPLNPKTGKTYGRETQAYQKWRAEQAGTVITEAEFSEIKKMNGSILSHPEIPQLLTGRGVAEGVVRAEVDGVQCQIRMDYFDPEVGILDLKTCRDIRFFEYDMRSFGYAFQMAFYRSVLRAASGRNYPVVMIAVDKTEFHVSGYWVIPAAELDVAERINSAAIRRLKECRETGKWPTGFERKQIFTLNK